MLPIRHIHTRLVDAPIEAVRPLLDSLWSGRPGDGFPFERIRRWRRDPEGVVGFGPGTRFGHGPYRFLVVERDVDHVLARIDTEGYLGAHGFTLAREGTKTRIVHDLRADVATPQWIVWKSLVGPVHDWAVTSCLARLDRHARGDVSWGPLVDEPWQLRAFEALRRAQAAFTTDVRRAA